MRGILKVFVIFEVIGAALGTIGDMVLIVLVPAFILGFLIAPVLILYSIEHVTNDANQGFAILLWMGSLILNATIWVVRESRAMSRRPLGRNVRAWRRFWMVLWGCELIAVQIILLVPMPFPSTR